MEGVPQAMATASEAESVSATVPFGMISLSRNVQRAGLQPAPDAKPATAAEGLAFNAAWNSVGADYFATVGLPVIRGRVPGAGAKLIGEVAVPELRGLTSSA